MKDPTNDRTMNDAKHADSTIANSTMDRELRELWLDDGRDAPIGEEVLMDVKKRSRQMTRRLLRRDLIETLATVFGFGVLASIALQAPGLVPKIALAVGGVFHFWPMWRLHQERRRHGSVATDAPIAEHLTLELRRVEGQIHLLGRVARWYVTPLALGSAIVLAGSATAAPGGMLGRLGSAVLSFSLVLLLFVAVGKWVTGANRRAVSTQLEPLRDDLVRALDALRAEVA